MSAATAGLFAAATAGSRKGDGRRTIGGAAVDDESARGTCDDDDDEMRDCIGAQFRGELTTATNARARRKRGDTDD